MTNVLITRTDGKTIDISLSQAEVYETNAKALKIVDIGSSYIQRISYTSDGMTEYIGLASPGTASSSASWQIRKLAYSGMNVVSILFADSNTSFDNVWDDRAILSYG